MFCSTGGGYTNTAPYSKRNDYTGNQYLTVGKPGNVGEENFHTGETYGFMIAMYNGDQNNIGGAFNYTNNTFTFIGSLNSSGVSGRSSGAGVEYGRGV